MTRLVYRRQARIGKRGAIDPRVETKHVESGQVFLLQRGVHQRSVLDIRDATVFRNKPSPEPEGWAAVDLDAVHEK